MDINLFSEWETANSDIPPEIRTYEYSNLKPNHYYKFRVAAVYSNNDSKMGPNTKKFLLRAMDFDMQPLPACDITSAETVNHTAIKLTWEVSQNWFFLSNILNTWLFSAPSQIRP